MGKFHNPKKARAWMYFVSGNCFDNPWVTVPWESNTQSLFCFSNVGDL